MRTLASIAALLLFPAFGAEERELKDSSGKTIIRYVAEVPSGLAPASTRDPLKQVGLFLCFPEHDRPTGDEILPVREALKRQGILDNYVIIGGHPQERKFGPADYEPIQSLIAWALKTYPINPRRVYMYGKGEGGKISGEFTMAHPELVTAAISYSWGWFKMPSELETALDPEKAPQFYMVLGRRDLAHHLTNVRDAYSRVQAKGYRVIYREFDDLGARTYHPPSNDEAIAWATRLRNRTLPLSKEEKALLGKAGARTEGHFRELAAVGGAEAGEVVQRLLSSRENDVRAAAARTCAEGNFGETAVEALGRAAADPSPVVRREAIRALGINANWRSPAAQRALIALVTSSAPEATSEDRAGAADGIAYAVRFQVRGVRQDPPLFRALVALLDGKQEELRTMAANILAPIRDGDFRGDMKRPERKAPEGGWQQWLDAITAKDAGYNRDHRACQEPGSEALTLYCQGGAMLSGRDLRTGAAVPRNPAKGFALTRQAAEMGYTPAQAALGMLYAVGKGVEQNLTEASKWWVKAAEGGHGLAATNASMVFKGGGTRTDAETAARLARQAAEYAAKESNE